MRNVGGVITFSYDLCVSFCDYDHDLNRSSVRRNCLFGRPISPVKIENVCYSLWAVTRARANGTYSALMTL